ncbi:MAG: reverse transcriptase-like protein [bacterium]|nr:reverse transcriptase-like protein [bacterium]
MKQLKFDQATASKILGGQITGTLRVADDKDIKTGDRLRIVEKIVHDTPSTWQVIGEASVVDVKTKLIKDLDKKDYEGRDVYSSPSDMLATLRQYYGADLSDQYPVKIIDFEFSAYEEPHSYFEAIGVSVAEQNKKEDVPKKVTLYGDGGSRGNPGPSAYGFVVYDENKKVLTRGSKYLGITTNNQAEYHSLLAGLGWCKAHHVREVHVFMDSLLVVNQMKGIFKVRNRDLWPLFESIKKLTNDFDIVHFTHVPRELNKAADAEVNKALDALSS